MPEHPRNLNEIKIKKELNDKINNSEREINTIRSRIRNYEYQKIINDLKTLIIFKLFNI